MGVQNSYLIFCLRKGGRTNGWQVPLVYRSALTLYFLRGMSKPSFSRPYTTEVVVYSAQRSLVFVFEPTSTFRLLVHKRSATVQSHVYLYETRFITMQYMVRPTDRKNVSVSSNNRRTIVVPLQRAVTLQKSVVQYINRITIIVKRRSCAALLRILQFNPLYQQLSIITRHKYNNYTNTFRMFTQLRLSLVIIT